MKSYFVPMNQSLVLFRPLLFRFWLCYDKFLIFLHVPERLKCVVRLKKDPAIQGSEISLDFPQTSHIFRIKFELRRLEVFSNPTRSDRLGDHWQASMESEGNANLSSRETSDKEISDNHHLPQNLSQGQLLSNKQIPVQGCSCVWWLSP